MQIRKDDVNNKWTIEFDHCSAVMLPDAQEGRCKFHIYNAYGHKVFAAWFTNIQKGLDECWFYYTKGYWSWEADEE
jgi:hypothetical protein